MLFIFLLLLILMKTKILKFMYAPITTILNPVILNKTEKEKNGTAIRSYKCINCRI